MNDFNFMGRVLLPKNLFSIIFLISFILLSFVFNFNHTFALTISPVKIETSGDPGQVLNGEFELINEQNEDKTFYSSTANFEARGESGAPYFLPDSSSGLASWIKVPESIFLKAGEKKSVSFTIEIPQDAEPGGHFAAIFWGTAPPQKGEKQQVAIGGKLGVLILLSVNGEIKEEGGLLEFKTNEGRKVFTSLPITFYYRFSNSGNERIKPAGELRIKNFLGFTTVVIDANRRDGNVLPRSTRKFEITWFDKNQDRLAVPSSLNLNKEDLGFFDAAKKQWNNFAFGPYKAELNLVYGRENNVAKSSIWFFVFPWQLLIIVFVVLVVVLLLGSVGIKKYNKWIISKASQLQK